MRILFATHTGAWSGAEAALLRLMESLRSEHELAVACPPSGPFAAKMDQVGIERLSIPAVEVSFRLDPVLTPRGLAQLGAAGVALTRAARRFDADIIHASTMRAGLIGAIATRIGGPPLVVRVHDHLPSSFAGRSVRLVIARSASEVVAVSDYTAGRFNQGLRRPAAVGVYNGIDHARFDPNAVAPAPLRAELGIGPEAHLLGQIAQITPWKGQDTAIRSLAELRRRGLDAHLVIVGRVNFVGKQVRYDNPRYLRTLHRLVEDLSVSEFVHFVGHRDDVPAVLRALDLLLLPSWDEPWGLVVMESLAMGTPTLVSSLGGAQEVLENGVTARILPPHRPVLWADAAYALLVDRESMRLMGERGRGVAAGFRDETHAREMLAIYERALANSAGDDTPRSFGRRRSKANA
jgi:glycosyltransferase involved in cell wall biosynthesis